MKIIYIPIEPYDRRYTRDWITDFPEKFEKMNQDYETIVGERIDTGGLNEDTVLDPCGTNYYKLSQLNKVIQKIHNKEIIDNDVIFFADLWFPGIESLFYIRNMLKVNFKIAGILHAGTWDKADFTCRYGMREWANNFEKSLLDGVDDIFVATEFHNYLILQDKGFKYQHKIHITGIPFYAKELKKKYDNKEKKNYVIFPHRIAPEKHPEMFEETEKLFKEMYPEMNVEFINTMDRCKTSKSYFELLAESKIVVSFADQETFGYSVLEAAALGCVPIVPNILSYTETIRRPFRFNNLTPLNAAEIIKIYLDRYPNGVQDACNETIQGCQQWSTSIIQMVLKLKDKYGV